jgi:U5 small nuclear ribonucleoprotein component
MSWFFSLDSFAQLYAEHSHGKESLDVVEFAKRLWGNVFYDAEARVFTKKASVGVRSFSYFILDPIYKLYSSVLTGGGGGPDSSPEKLGKFLTSRLGIKLARAELEMDIAPLLSLVAGLFFTGRGIGGLVDMIAKKLPSPVDGALRFAERYYTGDQGGDIALGIKRCDPRGRLMV